MAEALRSAMVQRLFRLNWKFALFVFYPWAVLFAVLGAGFLAGYGAAALLGLAWPLQMIAGAALATVLLHLCQTRIRKAFVFHLLDGWIFTWQQASGRHPAIDARLERFARHVVASVRPSRADEVLIVGHS